MLMGAKARAAMYGRPKADIYDVKSVARDVLRHRVMTNFAAEAADKTAEDVVAELIEESGWAKGA
jgi:MoxR-like ATPase